MASYRLTTETSSSRNTVEGVATPSRSEDGISRIVWSCDDVGKGVSVTVRPLEALGQFVCHRVDLMTTITRAGPEDA